MKVDQLHDEKLLKLSKVAKTTGISKQNPLYT